MDNQYAASLDSIQQARARLKDMVSQTPVLTCSFLDTLSGGRNLFFKCEVFQKGGSFKFRGACNAVFSLPEDVVRRGVLTHSSGNHAAAVALAAKLRQIPAHIVIPHNAPECKVENVKRYGGLITWCEPTIQSRESTASRIQDETNAVLIHPFNNSNVISGQGTTGLEFLEQVPQLEVIVIPISGGGLISGITIAAKALKPSIKIIAAEPKGADDALRSKAAGSIQQNSEPSTIADGLRATLGDLTWPVVRDLVDEVLTVDDAAIVEAMKLCYEHLKVVVEPSGAIGLAVVLLKQFQDIVPATRNVGIVLSGGNIDLAPLWKSYS